MPPVPLLPLLGAPGIGTAATGAVGVGAAAGAAATSALSLSTIASWGLLGGSVLYSMLSTPKGVDGPRLSEFSVHQSNFGVFRPITYGRMRVDGNVIWYRMPVERENKQRAGFLVKQTVARFYEYYGSWAVGLGEPCDAILRIWLNGQLWLDQSGEDWKEWVRAKKLLRPKTGPYEEEVRLYTGSETQQPDSYMEEIEGIGNVPAYRGEAYILLKNILLTYDFGNANPSVSAEKARGAHRITAWDILSSSDNRWTADMKKAFINQATSPAVGIAGQDDVRLFRYSNNPNGMMGFRSEDGLDWDREALAWTYPYHRTLTMSGKAPMKPVGSFVSPSSGHRIVLDHLGVACDIEGDSLAPLVAVDPFRAPPSARQKLLGAQPDLFPRYLPAIGSAHDGTVICFGGCNPFGGIIPYGASANGYYRDLWASTDGIHWTKRSDTPGAGYRTGACLVNNGSLTLLYGGQEQETADPRHNAVYRYDPDTYTFTQLTADLTGLGDSNAQVLGGCLFRNPADSSAGDLFTALVRRVSDEAFLVYQSSDGVTWKPMTDLELAVQAVDQANKTFTVAGDRRGSVNNPGRFWIDGSTGNDGEYTLAALSYDGTLDETTLTVNESIPSATADGTFRHYPMAGHLDATGFDRDSLPVVVVFWDEIWVIGGADTNRVAKTRTTFVPITVTVDALVRDLCTRCGIDAARVDASALANETLVGHSITSLTTAKDHLLPLQRAFLFDYACYDQKIHALKRGNQVPIPLDEDSFGASKRITEFTDRLECRIIPDLDLPSRIDVVYHDADNDFQPGTESASRRFLHADSTRTINLPVALTASQAKKIAEVLLWDAEQERTSIAFTLSYRWAKLTPGDVVTTSIDGVAYTLRLTKVQVDDLVVQCQAVPEHTEIYTLAPPALPGSKTSLTSFRKPATYIAFLDIPDFRNVPDEDFGFWFAAGPGETGIDWPGADIQVKVPDSTDYSAPVRIGAAACIGNADTVLAPPIHVALPDDVHPVDVEIATGEDQLQSITELRQLNEENLAVLGHEILSFRTAVSLGNRVYRLSNLVRGLYGTEWAVGTHQVNERFVLLKNAVRIPLPRKWSHTPLDYKITTAGQSLGEVTYQRFTCTALGKKPFAPVALEAERRSNGAWRIQWLGRGRGPVQQYYESGRPLIENQERYEIDFLADTSYPVVDHDPYHNLVLLNGSHAADFAAGETIAVSGLAGRNGNFTVASRSEMEGNTILETVEPLGGLPSTAVIRRVLHTQEMTVTDLDPDKKAFFELPAASFVTITADGSLATQYGQDDIYGGITDTLRIKIAQVAPLVKRGYETEEVFTV